MWTGNGQEDMNLGGTWDNSINSMVSNDGDWNVVMSRARGQNDLRPIKFAPTIRRCNEQGNCLHSLERSGRIVNCINEVTSGQGKWEKITVTVDSGAVDSVGPANMANGIKIRETPASRAGMKYRAANCNSIANQGEKVIQGVTREGKKIGMTFQIADVAKPLGSMRAMLDAGNEVVFEGGNSYITDKTDRVKTAIQERNGAFVFDLWMPKVKNESIMNVNTGRFHALMEEENDNEDFVRQDDLFA